MAWRRSYKCQNPRGGAASSTNWRYLTEEDRAGPRASEIMMSTTEAKKSFDLTTSDISQIQGFRRPHGSWGGGNTLTLYYHSDLVAASVRRHGQETFDKRVPEGRQMSGEAAKEKAVAATKEQEQAQISSDNAAYAVVPVDRLGNVKMYTLQKILVRLEGGKKKPFASKKDDVVQRIIAAGYSTEAEAKQMVLQKARDEAEAAKIAKACCQISRTAAQRCNLCSESCRDVGTDGQADGSVRGRGSFDRPVRAPRIDLPVKAAQVSCEWQ